MIFACESCAGCTAFDKCPVKKGKRENYLHYDDKQIRLAERRSQEETAEFRDRYRYRAGVEGTMSAFDLLTGVKQLRVRGLYAVRFYAVLKAVGLNIFRAAAYRKGEMPAKTGDERDTFIVFKMILDFRNPLCVKITHLEKLVIPLCGKFDFSLQNAA